VKARAILPKCRVARFFRKGVLGMSNPCVQREIAAGEQAALGRRVRIVLSTLAGLISGFDAVISQDLRFGSRLVLRNDIPAEASHGKYKRGFGTKLMRSFSETIQNETAFDVAARQRCEGCLTRGFWSLVCLAAKTWVTLSMCAWTSIPIAGGETAMLRHFPASTRTRIRTALLLFAFAGSLSGCATIGQGAAKPTEQVAVHDVWGFQDAIAAVSNSSLPCVVHVEVTGTRLQQVPRFGPFGFFFFSPQGISKVPIHALGSGILIDSAGDIVTNDHVVENADSITVHFYDGTERPARLLGSDRFTDIAVIKVEGIGGARVARFGDSDSLKVGEWVVAIGSPRGLDWTVTAGIVSATHRLSIDTRAPQGLEDFIQTDAAINPGNSGGPLLDLHGEVVGMNALIISQSQGSEGLGFAIPSNLMRTIAETLIREKKVTRGDLGIATQDIDSDIRFGLKLPPDLRGVVVAEAVPLGPGAAAAITAGDVVTSFQGNPVTSAAQLNRLAAQTAPGSRVALALVRKGSVLNVTLTVADQLDLAKKQAERPGYALLGVRVAAVSSALARSVGLTEAAGVVVEEVIAGSPCDSVGIAQGDIIFQVDGEDVNDADQFRQHVGDAIQTGSVVVLLRDGQSGKTGYMEIPLR